MSYGESYNDNRTTTSVRKRCRPMPLSQSISSSRSYPHSPGVTIAFKIKMIIHDLDDFGYPHDKTETYLHLHNMEMFTFIFGVSKARFLQEYVTWMADHGWFVDVSHVWFCPPFEDGILNFNYKQRPAGVLRS